MQIGFKTEQSSFVWAHRFVDLLLPLITLFSIVQIYSLAQWHERYLIFGLVGSLFFVFSAQTVGVYSNWRARPIFTGIKLILGAWILTWASLIVLAFLYKYSADFSRVVISFWAIITPIILIFYRIVVRSLLNKFRTQKHIQTIAIAGAGAMGKHIANIINSNKWLGYETVAFFDDNPNLHDSHINTIPVIGSTDQIAEASREKVFDQLYICLPLKAEEKIKSILNELTDTTAIVKFIPDLFSFNLMYASWSELNGIPVISIYDTPINSSFAKLIKRTEDIFFSIFILLFISPVLLWIAIKIRLESPGPIIFKQKRYGLNGKEINIYKFRSMTSLDNGQDIKQAQRDDPRITSFGQFIRRTSFDELPQFINVLQGKMSIVGPRPHAVAHNEEYRKLVPKYMQRHIVKPGITGWAQVNGWRGETDTLEKMEKRISFDLYYINNWSIWLDIKIMLLTPFKGFINKNAY